MTDLAAGTTVRALDFPPTASASDGTLITNISSTTYITGTPEVATTFMAPTSGRVMLWVSALGRDDTADQQVYVTVEVYEGTDATGTQILSPSALARGVSTMGEASNPMGHDRASLLSGLEAGTTYYARVVYRVLGGTTADIFYRGLIISPAT